MTSLQPSSNVFLTAGEYRSALDIARCLATHQNDLDAFAECLGFTLERCSHFAPNRGACFVIDGKSYVVVGKGERRDEIITCLHEAFHIIHSPRCVVPDMQMMQIIREESKANMFAAIAFAPRIRRYEHEQAVYNIYGPSHPEVAYARILHEQRFPSWI
jgi:hypothetical protein